MRFLCDEMLARLARLLRAAGYDTYLAQDGLHDAALMKLAREEGRIIVTRDKRLAAAASPDSVIVSGFGVEAEAKSLAAQLTIDWNAEPFSRCVMDNARLRDAGAGEMDEMPESARRGPGPFRLCPACNRLYWPGSHVRRMNERLARLTAQQA